jgi:hypothetical protein
MFSSPSSLIEDWASNGAVTGNLPIGGETWFIRFMPIFKLIICWIEPVELSLDRLTPTNKQDQDVKSLLITDGNKG